jgi:hypothetical protein
MSSIYGRSHLTPHLDDTPDGGPNWDRTSDIRLVRAALCR